MRSLRNMHRLHRWRAPLVALVAALASAPLAGGARSASPRVGLIAFTRSDGIYVMRADGSGIRRVRWAGPLLGGVAWSPNGRRLAFVTYEDGADGGLYLVNADGSAPTRIRGVAAATRPSWSPDGRRIALAAYTDWHQNREIWVINVDGSNLRLLAPLEYAGVFDVDWSPANNRFVFTSAGFGGGDMYVMNTNGRSLRRLAGVKGGGPDWSPDGRRIVFGQEGGVWVMDANGRSRTRLAPSGGSPVWSPDGRRIAFVRGDASTGSSEIYVMNADGRNVRRLTHNRVADGSPAWQPVAPAEK